MAQNSGRAGRSQAPTLCTHSVIQIVIAFIHLILPKVPLILYVDMWVELAGFSLGKLEGTASAHHFVEMLKYPNRQATPYSLPKGHDAAQWAQLEPDKLGGCRTGQGL